MGFLDYEELLLLSSPQHPPGGRKRLVGGGGHASAESSEGIDGADDVRTSSGVVFSGKAALLV